MRVKSANINAKCLKQSLAHSVSYILIISNHSITTSFYVGWKKEIVLNN